MRLKHQGWKEPVEFMQHSSTQWALLPRSMKSLLETSKGGAYPNDVSNQED